MRSHPSDQLSSHEIAALAAASTTNSVLESCNLPVADGVSIRGELAMVKS